MNGWENGIHSFDSFGRAIVAEAVRQATEQAATEGLSGDSAELALQFEVKFEEETQAERAPVPCCVCTKYEGSTLTICMGRCC